MFLVNAGYVSGDTWLCCSKIAEAEAAVSVNEKKWLVMHMHVQLQLDELRGPQTLGYVPADTWLCPC
jgi:hypothetical protein